MTNNIETRDRRTGDKEKKQPLKKLRRSVAWAGAGALALAGLWLADRDKSGQPDSAGPDKVHIVKYGETMWGLLSEAYPDDDPRIYLDEIDAQLPDDAAHKGYMVQPGDRIILSGNAEIGKTRDQIGGMVNVGRTKDGDIVLFDGSGSVDSKD